MNVGAENAVCIARFIQAGIPEVIYRVTRKQTQAFFSYFRVINTSEVETVILNIFLKVGTVIIPQIRLNLCFKPGNQLDVLDEGETLNLPTEDFEIIVMVDKPQVVCVTLSGKEITSGICN